jgi:hypothetical protein
MRLQRFAYATALALAAALAAGLAGELAARADDRMRDGIPMISAPELHYDLIIFDSLGSRGKPFGRYQRWALNSAGFRSDESTLAPRPGCTRVMTLGSSETFGVAGESPNKEYPAQLGDSLAPHGCYQVINAGIVGLTLPGITQMWKVWGSKFDPQVVVILANPMVYLGNDPPARIVVGKGRSQPRPPWWTPRLIEKAHQAIHYPEVIQRRRVQRQLDGLLQGHPPDWIFSSVPTERLDRYREDLDSLVTAVRAHGVKPVLVVYPMRFGGTLNQQDLDLLTAWRVFSPRATTAVMLAFENAAGDVVRDVGRARNIRVVDLASVMNGRREWFDDFVHYTDAGASVVAGQIGSVVRAVSPGTATASQ